MVFSYKRFLAKTIKSSAILLMGLSAVSFSQETWTPQSAKIQYSTVNSIRWTGAEFLAPTNSGLIKSEDGSSWESVNLNCGGYVLRKIANNSNVFVAIADSGYVLAGGHYGVVQSLMASDDGIDWEVVKTFSYRTALSDIEWCNDQFMVPITFFNELNWIRGELLVSTDGKTWENRRISCSEYHLNSISYGNGLYTGVGLYGRIVVSEDGVRWTDRSLMFGGDMKCAAWGDKGCVALGSEGALFSEDGYIWTKTGFHEYGYNVDLIWGGDKYVLVSEKGTIWSSVDGKTWHQHRSGSEYDLHGIAYGNDMFVTIGNKGMIMVSECVPYISEPEVSVLNNSDNRFSGNSIFNAVGFNASITGRAYTLNGRLTGNMKSGSSVSAGRYVISNSSANNSNKNKAVFVK